MPDPIPKKSGTENKQVQTNTEIGNIFDSIEGKMKLKRVESTVPITNNGAEIIILSGAIADTNKASGYVMNV